MLDLLNTNLLEIKEALENKKISSQELIEFYLKRIEKYDKKINAFLSLNENIINEAKIIDEKRSKNHTLPPFAGIPIAVKDNITTKHLPTTCASKILEGYYSPYDATAIKKLKEAGFLLLGKLNMDEFAMGSSCENSYYKTTKNPWNLDYVPGGSSGGSAASVAARLTPVALGSDTGGSIRQPASFCGVMGLKPTYGRVSRYGLVAFASSLDQIGTFTTNVIDSAIILSIIGQHDPLDSTSANITSYDYTKTVENNIKGLKIGLPKEFFSGGLEKSVEEAVSNSIKILTDSGAECISVSMPHTEYAIPVYYIIAPAEASSNLARYDGVKYGYRAESNTLEEMYKLTRTNGFGPEVKRRIMLGTYVLSAGYYEAYYLKAQKVRTLIKRDFEDVFKKVDIILTPTSPFTAFKLGEKMDDPLQMYLCDVFTIPLNLFGGCGLSLPCGFDNNALPIGLQIMGNYFNEDKLYKLANVFQRQTDFHKKIPQTVLGG
jgi:aspartyl-tRNA(Asn)/glutamyl-tRNA(Gln) amidotransferase subunit A